MKNTADKDKSFAPLVGRSPKVLILGTLPGQESLRTQQYYAYPHNVFWKIMFELSGQEYSLRYADRQALIQHSSLVLWDVCHQAIRPGSLDRAIVDEEPNPIDEFLKKHPEIHKVLFNGGKAEQLFFKYFEKKEGISYHRLLSTSPTNARYTYAQKLANWREHINTDVL